MADTLDLIAPARRAASDLRPRAGMILLAALSFAAIVPLIIIGIILERYIIKGMAAGAVK